MSAELTILGSSSATPTPNRFPSAQYLNFLDHHILIDCGEGTQMQLSKYKLKKSRIEYIFISHVHGDHILGLPGLIFSMNLMNRSLPLHIFAPKELFELLDLYIKHSEARMRFEIIHHVTNHLKTEVIFEDTMLRVTSFPLYHRVPTTGFLFEEQFRLKKINVTACEKNHIPFTFYNELKKGKDYMSADGQTNIANDLLTFETGETMQYAYCSDTSYNENVARQVEGVQLLYHEATFAHDKLDRATETMHTTALQAGKIAQLAGVKKLLIGHFSSRYDDLNVLLTEAQKEFEHTELAIEGSKFILY